MATIALFLTARLWLRLRDDVDDFIRHRIDQKNLVFHFRIAVVRKLGNLLSQFGRKAVRLDAFRQCGADFRGEILGARPVLSLSGFEGTPLAATQRTAFAAGEPAPKSFQDNRHLYSYVGFEPRAVGRGLGGIPGSRGRVRHPRAGECGTRGRACNPRAGGFGHQLSGTTTGARGAFAGVGQAGAGNARSKGYVKRVPPRPRKPGLRLSPLR